MDPILKEKIRQKLAGYLNREPSEAEIANGQTDVNIRGWIQSDDIKEQKVENEKLKTELIELKSK
jgi:hypothetical protein